MGFSQTPSSERVHIAFFGKRNAGKSSVLNAVTGQELAVVSEVKGTTTDPVYKSMELLPLGPVVLIDTPGIDDEGELGALRIKKSNQILNKADIAVLVIDGSQGASPEDEALLLRIREKKLLCAVVCNKVDLIPQEEEGGWNSRLSGLTGTEGLIPILPVSTVTGYGISELKECLVRMGKAEENQKKIVGDLLEPSDLVVLTIPIDQSAPKGRLILPQQQTIRDILEADATAVVVREYELANTLALLKKPPKMVITDSQVFASVSKDTPEDIPLTSFSILFARYKGNLASLAEGVRALDRIKKGDRILISEGCTHHRQCEDIGTVKLPAWIREYTKTEPEFVFTSGTEFPDDLSAYTMIIHCGGCMLGEREMGYRMKCAFDQGIPMTNYGIAIAHMKGILKRSLEPFPEF